MFFDNLAIPSDAKNVAEAYELINYLYRPDVAAKNSDFLSYANGNLASQKLVDRVKASAVGLTAEEYRAEWALETGWTGMTEIDVESADLDDLYEHGTIDLESARDLPCHTGMVLLSDKGSGAAP